MSKYKRYFVVKTSCTVYEVYDKSKKEALNMVKNNISHGLAGLPDQRGFNTILINKKLEEFKITKEIRHAK